MIEPAPIPGALFPPEVVARVASLEDWDAPLLPDEESPVALAVPKRRREFQAGRSCARQVLAAFGITDYALVADPDRVPIWPPGVVGSISHTRDSCAVAAARDGRILGLGLDIESAEPLEPKLVPMICAPPEREWIEMLPVDERDLWPKIFFSAKESVYKCCFPLARVYIDFKDVGISFDQSRQTFAPRFLSRWQPPPGTWIEGHYVIYSNLIFCGAVLQTVG